MEISFLCNVTPGGMPDYNTKLKEIIDAGGLNNTTDPKWMELNPLITEQVLQNAYEAGQRISYPGMFERRELKTMARIQVKKAMDRPDNGFKTNCDLMAFRLLTKDIKEIPSIVDMVVKVNTEKGNPVSIAPQRDQLMRYMFVYHADEGFLAEYQIGHPFAALKYKHDSGIRDKKEGFLDFRNAKIHVYKIGTEHLLNPTDGFNLVEVWKEGFGVEPTQEWLDCF